MRRLAGPEADELARALNESLSLRRDLRQHLVLWEMWSQDQAPERSAAAFIRAWKTRLRAESEGADTFAAAVRAELETRQSSGYVPERREPMVRRSSAVRSWLSGWWRAVHHRAGLAWAVSLLVVGLLGGWLLAGRIRRLHATKYALRRNLPHFIERLPDGT